MTRTYEFHHEHRRFRCSLAGDAGAPHEWLVYMDELFVGALTDVGADVSHGSLEASTVALAQERGFIVGSGENQERP